MPSPLIRNTSRQDLSDLSTLQAKVWKDYFKTERNIDVPLVRRTDLNLDYYLNKDPEGCLVAEVDDKIVGCIFSHVWGAVGWFGPVEVQTDMQGRGIGKALIEASVRYLESKGCETIGLETMASSVKNIGIYERLGFEAKALSNVFYKQMNVRNDLEDGNPMPLGKGDAQKCRPLWQEAMHGLDYGIEFESVTELGLGEIWGLETEKGLAHAIVHTYGMFESSQNAIIKLLVAPEGAFEEAALLLAKCENAAIERGCTGMFVRNYDATPPGSDFFTDRGYLLQSRSVRLILKGRDEMGKSIHVSCWSG